MKNRELQKIANTLVLYSYHVSNYGLMNGKLGIILFLYRYGQASNCEYYEDFAGELLDSVLEFTPNMSYDFENGLTGVGWVLNYLLKNNYVEGDPNDVLQDLDDKIYSNLKIGTTKSIYGPGIYLTERLKNKLDDSGIDEYIIDSLNFCNENIQKEINSFSLYYINSIIYFFFEIERNRSSIVETKNSIHNLPCIIHKIFEEKMFDNADLHILNKLIEKYKLIERREWIHINIYLQQLKNSQDLTIDSLIKISWQEELYFGNSKIGHMLEQHQISNFINKAHESLLIDDFLFSRGLAGLGNMLQSIHK